MATINKPKKKYVRNIDNSLAQKLVYNTKRWRSLRDLKLRNNPLCEECIKTNTITSAIEVHHINPFMNGSDVNNIKWLAFDYYNLQSLCYAHHKSKHNNYGL